MTARETRTHHPLNPRARRVAERLRERNQAGGRGSGPLITNRVSILDHSPVRHGIQAADRVLRRLARDRDGQADDRRQRNAEYPPHANRWRAVHCREAQRDRD